MSQFSQFVSTALADRQIGDAEAQEIRGLIYHDDRLDLDDVKLLVELYCGAETYAPAFEDMFFSTLEHVLLEDGTVDPSEQFYLLKMIYSDRQIRPREREFLRRLQKNSLRRSEEFDALCKTALDSPDRDWSVGGRPASKLKL